MVHRSNTFYQVEEMVGVALTIHEYHQYIGLCQLAGLASGDEIYSNCLLDQQYFLSFFHPFFLPVI